MCEKAVSRGLQETQSRKCCSAQNWESASLERRGAKKKSVIHCCSMTKFHATPAFTFPSKQDKSCLFLLFFIFLPFFLYWELCKSCVSCYLLSAGEERDVFWKLPTPFSICWAVAWKCLTCLALQAVCGCGFERFGIRKADSDVFWSSRELFVPSFNFDYLYTKACPWELKVVAFLFYCVGSGKASEKAFGK